MKLKAKNLFASTIMSASMGLATQVFAQSPLAHAHPGLGTNKIIQTDAEMADKQYAQEAQTWEAMKNHMYGIAGALTVAIAKQVPAKFE